MKNIFIVFLLLGFINLNARNHHDSMETQYSFGMRYKDGYRIEQNLQEAFKCFHRSALKGYAPAQYELALLFHYGMGVRQNQELAKLWFSRAARKGDYRSQTILYRFYAGPKPIKIK